ncbi:hypothetical protein HS1genome_1363 [Sulfodiicoccus acidiphilus]|uniref:HEPN domain-containing protein n=1 Tax=Sulfodiicoccus acidiphilus TaxID=1670455 RepID=A0A348B472_9CREN|nr:PaREP1 family protein [Sulfodiicoccus acidiphilus]BBD72974.1 hypothetical protein HS1genome_1363 [Sulfodiicoccus acidiphilus]GGT87612.1 hypothetical protein GCM10007116_01920 [Sulfodiicoccus acidiphilus]
MGKEGGRSGEILDSPREVISAASSFNLFLTMGPFVDIQEVILKIGEGIAPEDSVDALADRLDAEKLLKLRLDVSLFYLHRSEETSSPQLASEYLFKSVTEALKGLAQYLGFKGSRSEIVSLLTEALGDWVDESWEVAMVLHYDGYIDNNLDESDVAHYSIRVKEFLAKCYEVLT